MKDYIRHAIIAGAVRSGLNVVEKSASATPEQAQVLAVAWPAEGEGITKKATLARVLATGSMVMEAEQSLEAA